MLRDWGLGGIQMKNVRGSFNLFLRQQYKIFADNPEIPDHDILWILTNLPPQS